MIYIVMVCMATIQGQYCTSADRPGYTQIYHSAEACHHQADQMRIIAHQDFRCASRPDTTRWSVE